MFLLKARAVPFIDCKYQRSSSIKNMTEQMQVLVYNTFPCIDHQDHHVGVADGFQGFDN